MPGGHSFSNIWRRLAAILCGILVGHQAEAELGRGPGGQHRLGPFALVAAGQAVDVETSAGPSGVRASNSPPRR